ncbi:MAG TPA: ABC transporter ATP-binding protein, partial [Gammaproteobacteria bacterium]
DAAQHCFGLAAAGFVALVQIVVAIWLSPTFTLIVLSTTALVILVLARQLRRVNSLGEQLTERYDAIYKLTMNFVPMLRTAKMSGTTGTLLKRFRSENDRMNDVVASYVAHHTASTVSIQLAAGVVLSICIVLWMSVFSLGALEMSLLIVIFARLVPVLGQTLQLVQNLVHDLPAVENALSNIEDWRAQADDAPELVTTPVPRPRNSIELRSVSGGYAAADASPVLDGVSFSMPVGKLTLLSGPTGAGKSTIADVLSGLLRPAAGAIFVDGNPLSWRQIPDWRRVVGYVDQDTMLLTGSVRENLAWGAEELDGGRLERALRIAAVDEFIDDLPGGLEAPVGEYGSRLSGGQRQRIAIARELLRLPRLLILDEATSGLDLATEALLLERLRASDDQMTTLLISHRRSSLEYADVVVIVDKGRIVEVKADALGDRRADEPTEYSESIGLRVSG